MLTPEQLKELPLPLVTLYEDLDDFIMKDITRRISGALEMTSTAKYQIYAMENMGASMEQIKKEIVRLSSLSDQAIEKIFDDAMIQSHEFDKTIYQQAGIKVPSLASSASMNRLIASAKRQTKNELKNFTQSLGFVKDSKTGVKSQSLTELFRSQMDTAFFQVSTGASDPNSAMRRVIHTISKNNVRTIDYANGRMMQLDSAVRRAIRTGVNQTALKISDQNIKDMGTEWVFVTAHGGARNLGTGWANHEQWQGKAYLFKDLEMKTGYGHVEGLGGANCRHSFYPYFPGISTPITMEKEVDPFVWQGKEYDAYAATQKQRAYERRIRHLKRESMALDEAGLKLEAKKIRKESSTLRKEYTAFSEKAKLRPKYERMSVAKVSNPKHDKIKEVYAMENKGVKNRILKDEDVISKRKYETAILYDQNGKIIFQKTGKYNEVDFDEKQISLFKDNVLTHNHPLGTTFSPNDILTTASSGLQEMRATGEFGTYILRRNENLHLITDESKFKEEYFSTMNNRLSDYKKLYDDGILSKKEANFYLLHHVMNDINEKYRLDYKFIRKGG